MLIFYRRLYRYFDMTMRCICTCIKLLSVSPSRKAAAKARQQAAGK